VAGDTGRNGMAIEIFNWKKAQEYRAKGCEVYPYEVCGELKMLVLEQGKGRKL